MNVFQKCVAVFKKSVAVLSELLFLLFQCVAKLKVLFKNIRSVASMCCVILMYPLNIFYSVFLRILQRRNT
jgi:hypothetical protein